MDRQFTEALNSAFNRLKTEGAAAALTSVKTFFDEHQERIKEHFDTMSLQETEQEMKSRLEEIERLVKPLALTKADEVKAFVNHLKAFLQEEFEFRVKEMQSNLLLLKGIASFTLLLVLRLKIIMTAVVEWVEVTSTTNQQQFTPRLYHAVVKRRDKLYLFGGTAGFCFIERPFFNDLYEFNLKKGQSMWTQLKPRSSLPPARCGHSLISHRKRLHVFGGSGDDQRLFNDLWSYDPDDNVWGKRTYQGDDTIPSPRAFHTVVVFEDQMFVYGGAGDDSPGTVWALNMTSKSWKRIDGQAASSDIPVLPAPRMKHSAVLYGVQMFIFGGVTFDKSTVVDELWSFNLESYQWSQVQKEPAALWPSPRAEHASALIGNKWLISGGRAENDYSSKNGDPSSYPTCLSDVWYLQMSTIRWQRFDDGGLTRTTNGIPDPLGWSVTSLTSTPVAKTSFPMTRWGHQLSVWKRRSCEEAEETETDTVNRNVKRALLVTGGMSLAAMPLL